MDKVTKGVWTVHQGKGDRVYINCKGVSNEIGQGVIHPEQLAENNGVGMYGSSHLKDLSDAILDFLGEDKKVIPQHEPSDHEISRLKAKVSDLKGVLIILVENY